MSNEEMLRYSHDFLLYLSSSPLVPIIDLSYQRPTSGTTTNKKKKSKKEEWVLEEERFTFDSKGTNAIEEFKLMMKSKESKSIVEDVSTAVPMQDPPVVAPLTPGGKSRFLKFFDDETVSKPTTMNLPVQPPVQPLVEVSQQFHDQQQFQQQFQFQEQQQFHDQQQKQFNDQQQKQFNDQQQKQFNDQQQKQFNDQQQKQFQEQQQFQRVMAMLARSSMNPSEQNTMMNSHVPQMNGYYPQSPLQHVAHMGYQLPYPTMSLPMSTPSPMTRPIPVEPVPAVERVPIIAAQVIKEKVKPVNIKKKSYQDKVDPSNPLNAMLQSSIKAKRIQNNDLILQQLKNK
jgi:hypothetical protein